MKINRNREEKKRIRTLNQKRYQKAWLNSVTSGGFELKEDPRAPLFDEKYEEMKKYLAESDQKDEIDIALQAWAKGLQTEMDMQILREYAD